MKNRLSLLTMLLLIATVARAEDLQHLSLDDASKASPRIEADHGVKVEGASSLKITAKWPTTVCLGEVAGPEVENAKLVYSAQVKTDLESTGMAYLEMWVEVGGKQYFSRGMNDAVTEKSDWKRIQTPFAFQKGQKPDNVTLNLVINGKGTVWIDDVVLSKEPLR
jgi:hypothetical protein